MMIGNCSSKGTTLVGFDLHQTEKQPLFFWTSVELFQKSYYNERNQMFTGRFRRTKTRDHTKGRPESLEYELIRSKRKTIAICIDREGGVTVRAPLNAPQSAIERFLMEKQGWVLAKSAEMTKRALEKQAFRFEKGFFLPLLGRDYPIEPGQTVSFDGTFFHVPVGDAKSVRPLVEELYKELARRWILPRVAFYSSHTGWVPAGVRIGTATAAWGSCSGKNRLNFTWKLVAAEPDVIDYVVVHELAHLQEHNHSSRFWRLVEQELPDYRIRRAKLRILEEKLQKTGLS